MPKYDLVVAGAGLGGLAAAALVCKTNKKALLLESGSAVGGAVAKFRKQDFLFYPGPRLSFGFERGGALHRLNEALGITENASLRSPCFQVALPDRRITVYAEQSETMDELAREFPGEIDAVKRLYRDLRNLADRNSRNRLSVFLSAHRNAGRFLGSYRFSPEFMAFLDVQSRYFFLQPVRTLPLISLITLCDSAPFTVNGGFGKLAEQLLEAVLKNGGEIKHDISPAGLTLEAGSVAGPFGRVETGHVLVNTEREAGTSILCIAVREEVIPVGMLPEVLCVPDYSRTDEWFVLSVGDRDHQTPSGMRALTVTFTTPGRQISGEEQAGKINEIVPFLDRFSSLVEQYPDPGPSCEVPGKVSFIRHRAFGGRNLLGHASISGIYVLSDGAGTPLQSVSAAQYIADLIIQSR